MTPPTIAGADPAPAIAAARHDADRAAAHLRLADQSCRVASTAVLRADLEAAYGAALSLVADIRDALGALSVHEAHLAETADRPFEHEGADMSTLDPMSTETEAEARAAWGDR